MKIKELQNKIAEFDNARGWENSWNVKDLMLNMSEEIGELWNLIKWVDDEKQKELVEKNKEEVENFIGDVLFLIIKIANQAKIDVYHEERKEWLELGGAGIFRPEVVVPLLGENIPVLAWGPGFDRILMDYYKIKDIRELYKNDIKQLRKIKFWVKS